MKLYSEWNIDTFFSIFVHCDIIDIFCVHWTQPNLVIVKNQHVKTPQHSCWQWLHFFCIDSKSCSLAIRHSRFITTLPLDISLQYLNNDCVEALFIVLCCVVVLQCLLHLRMFFGKSETACPGGVERFNRSSYHITNEKKNWRGSKTLCESKGAQLLVISSTEEEVSWIQLIFHTVRIAVFPLLLCMNKWVQFTPYIKSSFVSTCKWHIVIRHQIDGINAIVWYQNWFKCLANRNTGIRHQIRSSKWRKSLDWSENQRYWEELGMGGWDTTDPRAVCIHDIITSL